MASSEAAWERELRDWLLGRLSRHRSTGGIALQGDELRHPPIARWWLFEGKQFPYLGGALAANWERVIGQARALLDTYNATWREESRPNGEIDWGQTLTRQITSPGRTFITRASQAGLTAEERAALLGWGTWLAGEWRLHAGTFSPDTVGGADALPRLQELTQSVNLQRCAHVARRSRWPFLRLVVAESLRVYLEPQELDQLPLPQDRATLFELVCLKRIACALADDPPAMTGVQWLTPDASNRIRVGSVTGQYQKTFGKNEVLERGYPADLAEAIRLFGLSVHERADLTFSLPEPCNGFTCILVEAKSGDEPPSAAVEQLRVYRETIRPSVAGRMLIWGITEKRNTVATIEQAISKQLRNGNGDVWAFSTADEVELVLKACGLSRAELAWTDGSTALTSSYQARRSVLGSVP